MSKEIDDLIAEAFKTYRSRVYTINIKNPPQHLNEFLNCGRTTKEAKVAYKYNHCRPVITPMGEFPTRMAAARAYGVHDATIAAWIAKKEGFTYKDKDEENQ